MKLGDEVILCPAHGAGSVCASAIAEREWTTIGIEKKVNPKLQVENMEESNLTGLELLANYEKPAALSAADFAEAGEKDDTYIIDVRNEVSYAAAHLPGSISIPLRNLPSFVGWFILDIRSEDELEAEGKIQNAENIHLTQLTKHYDELPQDKPLYIFCGSGLRSMTAASLLQNQGFINQRVVLGGIRWFGCLEFSDLSNCLKDKTISYIKAT